MQRKNSQLDARFLLRGTDSVVLSFWLEPIPEIRFILKGLRRVRFQELVNDPELREFICRNGSRMCLASEKHSSVDDFAKDLNTQEQEFVAGIEAVSLRVRLGMVLSNIWWAHEALLHPEWLELAKVPKRYSQELEQRLRAIKSSLKYLHGVPGCRTQLHADRDRELWLKKEKNPSLTWGQLGLRFGISDRAAESAYKGQVRREAARLKNLQQTTEGLQRFYAGDEEEGFRLLGVHIGPLNLRHGLTFNFEPVRHRQIDLRVLLRDKADSVVLSFGEAQMSEREFIRRSLHQLGFFDTVNDPELRELIHESRSWMSRASEKYDSVEAFRQSQSIRGQRFVATLEALSVKIRLGMIFSNIRWAYTALLDAEWITLARVPRRYNKELSQRLRAIRTSMKYLHGVPSYRSQLHADRDQELWQMKEKDSSLTWGQIGLRFGVSDEAAFSAYQRQARREVARLKNLEQVSAGLQRLYAGDEEEAFRLLRISIGSLRVRPLTAPESRASG